MKYSLALSAIALLSSASAQQTLYGQCGGVGWTGPTSCGSGAQCSSLNAYYYQCLAGAGGATTTSKTTTTTSVKTTTTPSTTSVKTTTTSSSTTVPVRTTSSSSVIKTTAPGSGTTTTSASSSSIKTTAAPTTASTTKGSSNPGGAITLSGNPFSGRKQYANSYYISEVLSIAIPSLIAEGKTSLTAAAKAAATVPSYVWFDTISKVPQLDTYLADIRSKNAAGSNIIGTFVVYDLPDRDCAALASNGELSIANGGVAAYKSQYIDAMVAIIKKYPDVPISLVVEPDSLANMITNMNVAKCSNAKSAYEECVTYAITNLNLPNVAMYMDAGHAGWLGWTDNLAKAGPYFAGIYKGAGSPAAVRGLATNVANYNGWKQTTCPSYTQGDPSCDENSYITALGPLLAQNGFNARFIVDQSRSGKQPTGQAQWGDWCNAIGTGFGIRPDTTPDNSLLDAFVWVKPGGECDGTSDTSATRYDAHCGYADALKPAPEAGTWFQAYFEQLLVNANPPFL